MRAKSHLRLLRVRPDAKKINLIKESLISLFYKEGQSLIGRHLPEIKQLLLKLRCALLPGVSRCIILMKAIFYLKGWLTSPRIRGTEDRHGEKEPRN